MDGNQAKQIGAAQLIRVDRPGSPVDFSTSGAHYELYYNVVEDAAGPPPRASRRGP